MKKQHRYFIDKIKTLEKKVKKVKKKKIKNKQQV